MLTDDTTDIFYRVFQPGYQEARSVLVSENRRLAYYTDAETARNIIQNREVWLRNAMVMNDFSEIEYGLNLTMKILSGSVGQAFRRAAHGMFSDAMDKVDMWLSQLVNDWYRETYIFCISMHEPLEDQTGKLSMWRAYGNTALIIRNDPLIVNTDDLGVFSIPVNYFKLNELEARLEKITNAVSANNQLIREQGEDMFVKISSVWCFLIPSERSIQVSLKRRNGGFISARQNRPARC